MDYKRLTEEDAASYWQLRLEALKGNPEAFLTTYQSALQKNNPVQQTADRLQSRDNYTFGAFYNNQLVGVVTLLPHTQHEKVRHKGDILAMYVSPASRGKGVGKKLLDMCTSTGRNIELEQLQLSVVASNASALALYETCGFTQYGYESGAIRLENGTYQDEILMAKYITD